MINKNSAKRLLRLVGQKLYAELDAIRATSNAKYPPIIVYQMGKVGSTSIYRSLKSSVLPNSIIFVHSLSDDVINQKKVHLNSGIRPVPYHLDLGIALKDRLKKKKFNHKFKIISLVRDPIALKISGTFQNPMFQDQLLQNSTGMFDPIRITNYLNAKLTSTNSFDYIFNWFDKELKTVFGIDVFAKPFNVNNGWTIFEGETADALIIRLEDLSSIGEDVISRFINVSENISLFQSNLRSWTKDEKVYKYVKENVKLDREACEKIYSNKFVTHFYSAEQIETMIDKWAK
ncbi:MAG: hypothetical protein PF482_07995 [Desulfobacteraceae bacterium]|jgi:hypothetical protein|nr:hypothetical protein [Desulfobacteraceae bacterium]